MTTKMLNFTELNIAEKYEFTLDINKTQLLPLDATKLTITNQSRKPTTISIAQFFNLQELNVNDCGLTSIDFVSPLVRLRVLSFAFNRVEDMCPISTLTELEYINAMGNQIADLEVFEQHEFPHLIYVNLQNNKLYSVCELGRHVNLTYLNIAENDIHGVTLFRTLFKLNTFICRSNHIAELCITPESAANLEYLDVGDNPITSHLCIMPKLRSLSIDMTKIPIASLLGLDLITLDISGIAISNDIWGVITTFTNLETLYMYGVDVSNVHPIVKLTKLHTVGISVDHFIDVRPLGRLEKLKNLDITVSSISDYAKLAAYAEQQRVNNRCY